MQEKIHLMEILYHGAEIKKWKRSYRAKVQVWVCILALQEKAQKNKLDSYRKFKHIKGLKENGNKYQQH